jgi:hypothetical protein
MGDPWTPSNGGENRIVKVLKIKGLPGRRLFFFSEAV